MQLKKIKNKEDLDFFRQVSSPITKEDEKYQKKCSIFCILTTR